jgi:hypothetical protein
VQPEHVLKSLGTGGKVPARQSLRIAWFMWSGKPLFVVSRLTREDLKARYRNKSPGVLWSLWNPLVPMGVIFTPWSASASAKRACCAPISKSSKGRERRARKIAMLQTSDRARRLSPAQPGWFGVWRVGAAEASW